MVPPRRLVPPVFKSAGITPVVCPLVLPCHPLGNIGGPLPCCDFKVVDVPEMNYFAIDKHHYDMPCIARGELCVRGYNICPEYLDNPEETQAAFDSEGYFHTGDIAVILPNYSFKV